MQSHTWVLLSLFRLGFVSVWSTGRASADWKPSSVTSGNPSSGASTVVASTWLGGGGESVDWAVVWDRFLRLPPRWPWGPRMSVVIRDVVSEEDELPAVTFRDSWGRGQAVWKPVGLRARLVGALGSSSPFLRFVIRELKKKTRVHSDREMKDFMI